MRVRARLVAALLCGALAATGFAAASFTQPVRAPATSSPPAAQPPSALWDRFPLGEATIETAAPASRPTAAEPGDSEEGQQLTLLAGLAALGLILLALAALLFLRTRQRRLVVESRQGLLAIMAKPAPAEEKLAQAQAFAAGLGCDKVSASRQHARGKQVTEESQVQSPEPESPAAPRGYTELGDRVAAVLQAAEEAAAQIRSDAQAAAEKLLSESKSEAQRVRVEADTEAKNTREAVESYASNHRREAEEKAAKVLSESESQARAGREAAEAMAKQIEERARTLEEEVREQERMIRGRMQRYLAALRDVSGQIEEVIGESGRGEPTLVEALDVERERAQQDGERAQQDG